MHQQRISWSTSIPLTRAWDHLRLSHKLGEPHSGLGISHDISAEFHVKKVQHVRNQPTQLGGPRQAGHYNNSIQKSWNLLLDVLLLIRVLGAKNLERPTLLRRKLWPETPVFPHVFPMVFLRIKRPSFGFSCECFCDPSFGQHHFESFPPLVTG